MKSKLRVVLIVICIAFVLTSCSKLQNSLPVIQLTGQDSGKSITVSKGQIFKVTLWNPGDGDYDFDAPQYNSSMLTLQGHMRNFPPPNSPAGDFGTDTWTFRAVNSGSGTLLINAERGTDQSTITPMFSGTIVIP